MHHFLHFVDHNQRVHNVECDRARLIAEQQSQEDLHTVVQRLVEAHVALLARPNAPSRRRLNEAGLLAVETLPFRLRDTRRRHAAMAVAQRMRQMLVRLLPFRVDQLDHCVVLELIGELHGRFIIGVLGQHHVGPEPEFDTRNVQKTHQCVRRIFAS